MLRKTVLPALLLPIVAFGCAQTAATGRDPVSRQEIVEHMKPIVQVEQRQQKLVTVMQQLPLMVRLDKEDAKKLKEFYDIYYVHHAAATIYLADGDFKSYQRHLDVASKELDALEATLKKVVKEHVPSMAP
ncbi:MAG TPA: hypothetical protein VE131_04400 [Terriglobales bacterium]|jgi:hypothetical protein|nr:hypothetical protein [Terriglobales bacterium]